MFGTFAVLARWMRGLVPLAAVWLFFAHADAVRAATASVDMRVKMSDGVTVLATISGQSPLVARPVIVEFSPYGTGSGTTYDGSAYNYLLVQIRGTGDSDGTFDALGPRTQQDVVETLRWACHQSWSDGRLGLNGFSASAITVYNSLHLSLPCVRTAVLRSGTFELYRDLLWPGGVSNFLPGLGVLALIGAPAAAEGFTRAQRAPTSGLDTAIGLTDAGLSGGLEHPTLDQWWRDRGFRGDVNQLPILMLDSFFDVESRGAFQAFQALKGSGAHLLVVGAHDGAPNGTDDGNGATKQWFDHYLLSAGDSVLRAPRVQMLMSDGSREGYLAGHFVRYSASDWPVPGTTWRSLWLSAARSGSGSSINDGSLADSRPISTATQSYAAVPTTPSTSDVPNTAIVGPDGANQAANAFPLTTETTLSEPQALTYTTGPLQDDLLSVGPAALDLRLSSTASETALWAVISDVWPDGSSHPLTVGRLLSAYPSVDSRQSLHDQNGDIVQPYGEYSSKSDAAPAAERTYQIEFWPIGNRFKRGHRIRLVVLGASGASSPSVPALNTVRLGGANASRLLLPVIPVSQPTLIRGCPSATGQLSATTLGPGRLGMTRAALRRAFVRSSTHGRRSMDYFCLSPVGIRAGYVRDRVALLLTANRRYALRGVRAGTRLSTVARRLGVGRPFHIGKNWWYLIAGRQSAGVLKVRGGVIQEVGLASKPLTSTRGQARAFLSGFG